MSTHQLLVLAASVKYWRLGSHSIDHQDKESQDSFQYLLILFIVYECNAPHLFVYLHSPSPPLSSLAECQGQQNILSQTNLGHLLRERITSRMLQHNIHNIRLEAVLIEQNDCLLLSFICGALLSFIIFPNTCHVRSGELK